MLNLLRMDNVFLKYLVIQVNGKQLCYWPGLSLLYINKPNKEQ